MPDRLFYILPDRIKSNKTERHGSRSLHKRAAVKQLFFSKKFNKPALIYISSKGGVCRKSAVKIKF